MSRHTFRFMVAVLFIVGGLGWAAPNAEAAGRTAQGPDLWSSALRWVADLWQENVASVWETSGSAGTQNTQPPETATGDEGWMIDPNG